MGAALIPRLPARLPSAAPPRTGGTGADRALPRRPRTTVPPTPAGTFRVAGCGPLQPGTARAYGDRIPVPDGVERPRPHKDVPSRDDMSPAAQDVPTRDNMSPNVRSAPAHAVGPDHEWGTHTDRPFAAPPATGTPSSQPPRAGQRHKQAAPHLRCGAAGVGAPVQARCSLSGDECSRHLSGTPNPERGHRTSSVGGILLPDPPS